MQQGGDEPWDVARDCHVRREGELHLRGFDRGQHEAGRGRLVEVGEGETGAVDGVGVIVDVADIAELVVPEAVDADEEVPWQHRAHAQVHKDQAAN